MKTIKTMSLVMKSEDMYKILLEGFLLYTITLGAIVAIGLILYIFINSGKISYCVTCKQAVVQLRPKYNWLIAILGLLTAGILTIIYTVQYFLASSNCPKCRSELVYVTKDQLNAMLRMRVRDDNDE